MKRDISMKYVQGSTRYDLFYIIIVTGHYRSRAKLVLNWTIKRLCTYIKPSNFMIFKIFKSLHAYNLWLQVK